jgi:hypothetical protein
MKLAVVRVDDRESGADKALSLRAVIEQTAQP